MNDKLNQWLAIIDDENRRIIEIAKELLKLGMSIEDIQKVTKLTKEEIQKLENE